MNSNQHAHIKDLSHDPKNARKHTPRNVGTIVSALHEVGAARSIVIDEDGVVLAGNATLDAAAEAGITRLRVIETDGQELVAVKRIGLTAEQKTRLALYDNRAAELAEWDDEVLKALAMEGQLSGMWNEDELAALLTEDEPVYSQKIEAPVYEPTGECPVVASLCDRSKADALLSQIETSKAPEEVKAFLRYAAERHVVFDFRNIAEYYAHASADVQHLMEASALVIVDFDKAVEHGFVSLTKELAAIYEAEYENA
jgi:hypothetical protein